jgi:hypothetical protein
MVSEVLEYVMITNNSSYIINVPKKLSQSTFSKLKVFVVCDSYHQNVVVAHNSHSLALSVR